MPTKDELEAENAQLRAELEELKAAANDPASQPNTRPAPTLPTFGMSEGTRLELEQAANRARETGKPVIIVEPFTGAKIQVDKDGHARHIGPDGEPVDDDELDLERLEAPDTTTLDDLSSSSAQHTL